MVISGPRWKTHPERINSIKNMSHSELSRRRLVPRKLKPIPEPTPPGEEPVAKPEEEVHDDPDDAEASGDDSAPESEPTE